MATNEPLSDRTLFITGSSRGIGLDLATLALEKGATVIGLSRSSSVIEHVAYHHVQANLSHLSELVECFSQTLQDFPAIDCLINNAGYSQDSLMLYSSQDELETVLSINLSSTFLLSQAFIQHKIKQNKPGNIIFSGSLAQYGAPSNASYAMAKGGLVGLNKAIAQAHQQDNIISALAIIGFIDNEMTRHYPDFAKKVLINSSCLRRAGTCEEVAASLLSLACNRDRHLSGMMVHISGGLIDFPLDFPGEKT